MFVENCSRKNDLNPLFIYQSLFNILNRIDITYLFEKFFILQKRLQFAEDKRLLLKRFEYLFNCTGDNIL